MIKTDSSYFKSDKIKIFEEIVKISKQLKEQGKTIGLCVGGYDIVHPGHMKHLESAKSFCDVLIVGITADKFVSKRKGSGRPVYDEILRAYSVSQIIHTNYIFVSPYPKAIEAIEQIKPNYYIKGPDFIKKNTPGITSEREAIKKVSGEMKYTEDEKMSTSEIIRYIKDILDEKKILFLLDRDGTLIKENSYLGRYDNWKEETKLNKPVIDAIKEYKDAIKIVISNQTGVALNYFNEKRVNEINSYVHKMLKKNGITISDWQYCPYADKAYADSSKKKINLNYVKEKSGRKPAVHMAEKALSKLGISREEFDKIIMFGDREDDKLFANKYSAKFIDVNNKSSEEIKNEIKEKIA